ncbi:DUF3219 family protein [Heyndrickxia sp. MSNUG]|uniref:DUF3219 family protein n=1 Tax=Heyndrickxia sp. MSNUG TaxID=3136677 RepID=UPI003C2E5690
MIKEIILNDQVILVSQYEESNINGFTQISIEFKVTSNEYHDITTLLYEGEFDVIVPESNLEFRGRIVEYSTSVTNLYESEQVGIFKLVLLEKKE